MNELIPPSVLAGSQQTESAGCDDGGTPSPTPVATPAPTPQPTTCAGEYSEVVVDAEPMNAPSPEAALAILVSGTGRTANSYERVPVDPSRNKRNADRYASFATRRADGSVATLTIFERNKAGWTFSSERTCRG